MNPHSRFATEIQLVIFDWAGTTIDHGSRAPAAAFMEGFRRRGVEVTVEQARGPMGMGKRDHIQAMLAMPPIAQAWRRAHGHEATAQEIDALYADFVPVLMDVLPDYCDLIPGVVDAVNALRALGCKIGATTGYFEEAMALCQMRATEQGYTPDSSLAATQVQAGRPAPWLILETMSRLQVYPPATVVKVGDTVPDIEAGHNAGVWTVGVTRTGNSIGLSAAEFAALSTAEQQQRLAEARHELAQAEAHFVVESVADVPGVVHEINRRLHEGVRP